MRAERATVGRERSVLSSCFSLFVLLMLFLASVSCGVQWGCYFRFLNSFVFYFGFLKFMYPSGVVNT